jgi:outer membrane protein assembly factor BamB
MQRWSFLDAQGTGIEPFPVLDNLGQVIVTTNYGKIYFIDYATGGAAGDLQFGGAFSAPVIGAPGVVYYGSVAPYGFYAIDTVARMQKWHYPVPNNGDASAAPAVGVDKVYFVDSTNSRLFALDTVSGALVFDVPVAGQALGSPVLAVDAIYVATRMNGIAAFDAQSGELKWQKPTGLDVVQPALLATGYLVSSTVDGNAFILDRNGNNKLSIPLGGNVIAPPRIDAADVMYFATDQGTVAYVGQSLRWQSQVTGKLVIGDKRIVVLPATQTLAAIGP